MHLIFKDFLFWRSGGNPASMSTVLLSFTVCGRFSWNLIMFVGMTTAFLHFPNTQEVVRIKIIFVPWGQFVKSLVSLLCVNIMSNTTASFTVCRLQSFSTFRILFVYSAAANLHY